MGEMKIAECIAFLRKNGYIVLKWTRRMESDANECVALEEKGIDKDCDGCECHICLMQRELF